MTDWDAPLMSPALWRLTLYSFLLISVLLLGVSLALGRGLWPPRAALVALVPLWCVANLALAYGVHRTAYTIESHDAFCVSCHLHEAEYDRFHGGRASVSLDLAAFHRRRENGFTCISCHVGEGVRGRAAVLLLAGLDVVHYTIGQYQRELEGMRHPLTDRTCTKCHAPNDLHGFHREKDHAAHAAQCLTCHVVHAPTTETLGFIDYQRWPQEVLGPCQRCHPALLQ
jgi:nitrate/TMAO reductase-like tetraheme cytochrome c subunit